LGERHISASQTHCKKIRHARRIFSGEVARAQAARAAFTPRAVCDSARVLSLSFIERCAMPSLPITFACGLYDRMLALQTGDIKPDGIDLNFLAIDNPREIFDRMSNRLEFDACEMSSSEFVSRYAAKKLPFVALPVFASRVFRHGFIVVNRKFITSAKDLAGKRIGVPLYTQTAAIFVRGLMQHDLGVDLSTIEWVQGAVNEPGAYGNPSVMPLLKPIKITPNQSGKSLSDLLAAGEIHAIIGSNMPRALKRHPDVVRLFPDYRAREKDYYRRTKIFPIMHLVVIRNDVYERHPFVATSLYNAFEAAKDWAREKMRFPGTLRYMLPWLPDDIEEIDALFGGDCWPYGVEPNRPTLEALVSYMVEQGLIAEPIPIEKLFVPTFG
jgi:4,5-dihydroxyphthalate decarboxylase